MFMLPDPLYDYEVELVAFGSGTPVDGIKVVQTSSDAVPLEYGIALLYSRRPLPCSEFPEPARWRDPSQYNTIPPLHRVAMIGYNAPPNMDKLYPLYPYAHQDQLDDAYRKLYPNHLSYRTGVTSQKYFSTSAVCHLVSGHNGSSGGRILQKMES